MENLENRNMSKLDLKVSEEAPRPYHMAQDFLPASSLKQGPNLNKQKGRKTGKL